VKPDSPAGVRFRALALVVLGVVALAGGCGRGSSQTPLRSSASLAERLAWLMEEHRTEFGVPALQMGVLKDGNVVFAGAGGIGNSRTHRAITTQSLFHMASLSKPFVATAILQLAEQGKLGLEDPVQDHLPYFKLKDERYRLITIRQVLAHTSGLPDVRDYEWDAPRHDDGAAERYVRSLSNLGLLSAPGATFHYSNIGYDILGDVIAKASGMSFEAYMGEHIFKPLTMKNSTFLKVEVPDSLAVSPHHRGLFTFFTVRPGSVYPYNRAHAPSSTLHSNVNDMLKFCAAMLDSTQAGGAQLLGPESRRMAWTEQADQGLADARKAEWMGRVGLGWFIGSYKGHRMISYVGADPGFRASVALIPDKSIAVVVMGNSDTMRVGRLVRGALDLALQ
jgi:CubicO group peptidase (beta-lactamase class C family)